MCSYGLICLPLYRMYHQLLNFFIFFSIYLCLSALSHLRHVLYMDCKCPELPVCSHIFVFILLRGYLNIYGLKRQTIYKPVLHFYGCFALHVSAMNRYYWCVNGHILLQSSVWQRCWNIEWVVCFCSLFLYQCIFFFLLGRNFGVIVYFQCSSSWFLFQNLKDSLIAYIFAF